ncbi:MAG: DNA-3-methyladenine glycosylase family protein [Pseudohongiellaceae bacterium]
MTISLGYRPPYDWRALLRFLEYRAISGVEQVGERSYARSFALDGEPGHLLVTFAEREPSLTLTIRTQQSRQLYHIIDRVRSLFDLRADSDLIDRNLSQNKLLEELVKAFPGQRVPGCWDGFEIGVRAILGQQVSVKAASTLVARVAARHGTPYQSDAAPVGLTHVFPDAATLATANLDGLGITGSRIAAIQALARAVTDGELVMDSTVATADFVARACQIKGIGEWTAQYMAMRALSDPNAFPHGDLILRRAAAPERETLTPKQMLALAEAWQPWRAYAVLLLWRGYSQSLVK